MLLEDLIEYLEECLEEHGNVNVCVYNPCHELPCEAIVALNHENDFYVVWCEDDIKSGDFLMLE